MLVDVHTHLSDRLFKENSKKYSVPLIIERAKKAGIKVIITNGLGPVDNEEQLEFAKNYDIVKPAIGFYPTNAQEYSDAELNDVIGKTINLILENKDKIVAIGEIGLDKKDPRSVEEWNNQVKVFKSLLSLAEKLRFPVIVHSRKAEREVINILSEFNLSSVIMHCFGGKMRLVKECIEKGYYFSIPAILKRSSHFQAIVNLVDLSHLLTETDAPYLSPFKDQLNEPAFVSETIEMIAKLKGTVSEDTKKVIFKNYLDCFL